MKEVYRLELQEKILIENLLVFKKHVKSIEFVSYVVGDLPLVFINDFNFLGPAA